MDIGDCLSNDDNAFPKCNGGGWGSLFSELLTVAAVCSTVASGTTAADGVDPRCRTGR